MPQPAMHLLLAERALERWREDPERSPIPLADPPARNAFLHGSLGPDMGLFPGADPLSSWHVHRGGGSDVARSLVAAEDPLLRAFGWGWVTHVISDALIHPLVNLGADALLRDLGVHDAASQPRLRLAAHIRVELGIEGWYAGQSGPRRPARLRHVFHRASIEPLVDILRTTYDVDFATGPILAAHRGVSPFAAACVTLAHLLAADLRHAGPRRARERDFLRLPGARRVVSSMVEANSPAWAFLNPVRPAHWLVERVAAACDAYMGELQDYVDAGLGALPNYDLNSGARLGEPAAQVA
jgi:hypothetical protein